MGIDSYSILSSWLLHAVKNIHEKMKIKNAIQVISLFIVDNLKFSGGGVDFLMELTNIKHAS